MTSARTWLPQAALDALLVLLFAVAGRSSHAESLTITGVMTTAWPFLAGLALGWIVSSGWNSPARIFPTGVTIWCGTVLFGMALRVATGGGFAMAFLLVAALFLGAALIGSRMAMGRALGRKSRSVQ